MSSQTAWVRPVLGRRTRRVLVGALTIGAATPGLNSCVQPAVQQRPGWIPAGGRLLSRFEIHCEHEIALLFFGVPIPRSIPRTTDSLSPLYIFPS